MVVYIRLTLWPLGYVQEFHQKPDLLDHEDSPLI